MTIDVARVFFHEGDDPRVPSEILLQRLENHTGNVAKLVELWQQEADDTDLVLNPATANKVIAAAKLHDVGKPERFHIEARTRRQRLDGHDVEIFTKYEYSFSGHRFLAESEDLYVQELAQGHHTYSVEDLTGAIARLRRRGYDASRFAQDLYILEMCDQIEAEIAVRTLEGETEGRTFMEFTVIPENDKTYALDPYPFDREQISLTFEYYRMVLLDDQKRVLLGIKPEDPRRLAQTLEGFIKDALRASSLPVEQVSVEIKPLLRESVPRRPFNDIQQLYRDICGFAPNAMQCDLYQRLAQGDDALLVRAPTGSGKTEAVWLPALALGKRLIMPLPTRSLLEDHERRLTNYLRKFSSLTQNRNRPIAMIIDTGEESRRYVFVNGQMRAPQRRHLYKAEVILTTLDKFLYRYFGFGDMHKSFIYPLRIRDGARTLICFDEAHTYDGVSFINFRRLVRALYESGQSLVVMTATMPDAYKKDMDFLRELDYTGTSALPERKLSIVHSEHDDLSEALVAQTVTLWQRGMRKIIVVAESVGFRTEIEDRQRRALRDGAFNVYEKLKQHNGLTGLVARESLLLYHGRMDAIERARVYESLKRLDNDAAAAYVVVTTSAIEVGCDLNAQALVTEICNPEQLIQRAGRCNRRANFETAEVVVVIPKDPYPDGGWIKPYVRSLSRDEEADYLEYLKGMHGSTFDHNAVMKKIAKRPTADYRVETLFEMLDEYVYGARLENKPLHDRGFVVTRSWEPTLIFEIPYDRGYRRVSVPFSMCACGRGEYPDPGALVQQVDYNHDSNRESLRRVSGGPIYGKQIVVRLSQGLLQSSFEYDSECGLVDVPKVFTWKRNFDYKVVMQVPNEDGSPGPIIWYFRDMPDDGYFTGYVKEITIEEVEDQEVEEGAIEDDTEE
ncbi:MAG: CRISPR-associated helicase Cas3 [Candidatus Tectimicrobiota bacterium]|nr:MAG: CRISPR-associated helicase Cas3 [Candidatus Tectomicrobia bacterium]